MLREFFYAATALIKETKQFIPEATASGNAFAAFGMTSLCYLASPFLTIYLIPWVVVGSGGGIIAATPGAIALLVAAIGGISYMVYKKNQAKKKLNLNFYVDYDHEALVHALKSSVFINQIPMTLN